MHPQPRFTLIESMLVIAGIGILASIAIPQFQTYISSSMRYRGRVDAAKAAMKETHESYDYTAHARDTTNPGSFVLPSIASVGDTYVAGTGHGIIMWACDKALITADGKIANGSTAASSKPNLYLHPSC